jgi:hypothetical protein
MLFFTILHLLLNLVPFNHVLGKIILGPRTEMASFQDTLNRLRISLWYKIYTILSNLFLLFLFWILLPVNIKIIDYL